MMIHILPIVVVMYVLLGLFLRGLVHNPAPTTPVRLTRHVLWWLAHMVVLILVVVLALPLAFAGLSPVAIVATCALFVPLLSTWLFVLAWGVFKFLGLIQ